MNQYGRLAQRQWKEFMPARSSMLDDPEAFFTQMGEDMAEEVSMLKDQLERNLPPTQDYLQRVSDLNRVKRQAEEIVLNEMIHTQISPELEHLDLEDQLEEVISKLPTPASLQSRIDRIWDHAEDMIESDPTRDISEGGT